MALSRRRKLVLLLVVLPLVLVAALLVALLTPAVQTFAARRALAGQGGELERLSVGFGGAELSGLKIAQPGLKIAVPAFKADLPLLGLAGGAIDLRSLVAHDLVIDLDPGAMAAAAASKTPADETRSAKPFDGVLNALALPELRAEGIDLAGRLRVAGKQPLEATFTLTGGGIRAGQAGKVELKIEAKAGLGTVTTSFLLTPTLGADGRLNALEAVAEALARSKLLKQPATLRTRLAITRQGAGEAYSFRLIAGEAPLIELDTRWAPGATELPGRWKIALRDADLAPFALGLALPDFSLAGAGDLAVAGTEKIRLGGDLKLSADGLEIIGLPKLGPVSADALFNVEASATSVRVDNFLLKVAGTSPVLAVESRQAFTLATATRQIAPRTPGADLAEVRLVALPAEWVKLFTPDLTLGGPVTGAWTVRAENEGVAVASSQPLVVSAPVYASAGKPLLAFDAVRVEDLAFKQNAAGFTASVGRLRVIVAGADIVSLKLDAEQKTGAPITAKAELRAQLAALADQPMLRGQTRLSAGQAVVALDATVADAITAGAQVRITGLRAAGAGDLPEVALDAALARDAAGVLTAKLPLTVRNVAANRGSDVLLGVTLTPGKPDQIIAAKLSSQVLHVPDLQLFAALAAQTSKPAAPAPVSPAPAAASAGPLWAGTTGDLEISLARIVYAPGVEVLNTKGRVALTRDAATLEKLQSLLGTGGALDVTGALRWIASSKGYALAADVKGRDVAVGPLLKSLAPRDAVPLEGTYDLAATLAGQGADPGAAAAAGAVDLKLTGRKGVLRAINLDTNKYARAGSAIAGLAGLAGALSGNQELSQRANQVAALNAVARAFGNLAYDELALEARRAADGTVEIGKVGLLSPQLRLSGAGGLRNLPGRTLTEQPLNLRLELGAKGALAGNLETLRLLSPAASGADAPADGFSTLAEPLVLDGTLKQIGTAQVTRLLSRAIGL